MEVQQAVLGGLYCHPFRVTIYQRILLFARDLVDLYFLWPCRLIVDGETILIVIL